MARKSKRAARPEQDRIAELEARVVFLEQGLARKDAAIDIMTMSIAVIGAQIAAQAKTTKQKAGLQILLNNIADLQLCVPRATDGTPGYLATIAELAPKDEGHDEDQDGDPGANH